MQEAGRSDSYGNIPYTALSGDTARRSRPMDSNAAPRGRSTLRKAAQVPSRQEVGVAAAKSPAAQPSSKAVYSGELSFAIAVPPSS